MLTLQTMKSDPAVLNAVIGDPGQRYELLLRKDIKKQSAAYEFRPWCDPNRTFFEGRVPMAGDDAGTVLAALQACREGMAALKKDWTGTQAALSHMERSMDAASEKLRHSLKGWKAMP